MEVGPMDRPQVILFVQEGLALKLHAPELQLPAFLGEDKGAGGVGGHRGPAQGAHRAGGWAASRLEGTEVMCPQEVLGGFLHGSHIQAVCLKRPAPVSFKYRQPVRPGAAGS